MALTAQHRSGLVARQVRRHLEEPRPGPPGLVLQRPHERLLRQVPGPIGVPHLSVEKADQVREDAPVQLVPVEAHDSFRRGITAAETRRGSASPAWPW